MECVFYNNEKEEEFSMKMEVVRVKDSNFLGHEFLEKFSVDVKTEATEYHAALQEVYFYRYDRMDTSEWESQMDYIHELVSSSCPMSYQETAQHLGIPMTEVIAKSNMYDFF